MNGNKLKLVAKILLKDKIMEFDNLISEQTASDMATFLKRNQKILETVINVEYLIETKEKITATTILLAVVIKNKLIMTIVWSGEEYSGQVKRGITQMLKKRNINPIKWKNKNIEREILASNPKRGEFLPLLFHKLNKELESESLSIGFFERGDDAYYFFVIPKTDFEQIINIKEDGLIILDTNIYDIYITEIGENTTKIMIYLKNKFNIPLLEIRSFIQQDEILIATGNLAIMNFAKDEAESLGAKTEIRKRNE